MVVPYRSVLFAGSIIKSTGAECVQIFRVDMLAIYGHKYLKNFIHILNLLASITAVTISVTHICTS